MDKEKEYLLDLNQRGSHCRVGVEVPFDVLIYSAISRETHKPFVVRYIDLATKGTCWNGYAKMSSCVLSLFISLNKVTGQPTSEFSEIH